MNQRTAFLTGGSGFLGRNLIGYLRERGYQVRALARSESASATVSAAGAEPVRGDLDQDDALRAGMAGCALVLHSAALAEEFGAPADFHRVNVVGTERVLAAARAAAVPRLVHVSTEAVLLGGPPIVNADESWPLPAHPIGLYAASKGQAELRVRAANCAELATLIIRPRLIWGQGDTSVLPRIVAAVRRGEFAWIGGGRHLTSSCHVTNVCEGALLCAERGRPGETYFLTDGPPQPMRELLTSLLRTQGVEPGDRSLPRPLAYAAAALLEWGATTLGVPKVPPVTRMGARLIGEEVTVNDAKARRELGYAAQVSRAAGLRAMTVA